MGKIASKWKEYQDEVLVDIDMTGRDGLIDETLFFGGAAAMLSVVQDAFAADVPAEEVVARLQAVHDELLDFHSRVTEGIDLI